jgi:hypothetical protein
MRRDWIGVVVSGIVGVVEEGRGVLRRGRILDRIGNFWREPFSQPAFR